MCSYDLRTVDSVAGIDRRRLLGACRLVHTHVQRLILHDDLWQHRREIDGKAVLQIDLSKLLQVCHVLLGLVDADVLAYLRVGRV